MKLLIVEDEPLERRALNRLVELGFPGRFQEIFTASDGREAVREAERRRPDLVLMDINLPLMDGLEAMREIRRTNKETRFIMISAYSSYEYLRDAMRNSAIDYILKPYSPQTLYEALNRVLADFKPGEELYGNLRVIGQVKKLLEEEYGKNWSLEEIASRVNMNKSYLGRIFRDETGMTVMNYLRAVRLKRAKELLLLGMSVNEAAGEVGFEDASYFGRIFKQETGISPVHYRQKAAENMENIRELED